MARIIAYIPASPDAPRQRRRVTDECARAGHRITHVTADPVEAREMKDSGLVSGIAVVATSHLAHCYPEDIVIGPRPRRHRAGTGATVLVTAAGVVGWFARHRLAGAGITAATVTAAALSTTVLQSETADHGTLADPPPIFASPAEAHPPLTDATRPTPRTSPAAAPRIGGTEPEPLPAPTDRAAALGPGAAPDDVPPQALSEEQPPAPAPEPSPDPLPEPPSGASPEPSPEASPEPDPAPAAGETEPDGGGGLLCLDLAPLIKLDGCLLG